MIINGNSYKITLGYQAPADPKEETVQYLTMMDGSIEAIDFGSRLQSVANITVVEMTKLEFISLTEYVIANVGNKVLIQRENTYENIFIDNYGGGLDEDEYYVYITKGDTLQEEDFSITRSLFTMKLEFVLAGNIEESIPNEANTSLIDILVEIDTLNGATRSATAPVSPEVNDQWLDTDDNKLYIYDEDELDWLFLYDIAPDDSDVGFYQGTFYLSTFATTTIDALTYVSGIINYKAVQLSGQNIDISKGSAIARKDGFDFSVSNDSRFWKYIVDNSIALFNVPCICYLYMDSVKQKLYTGINQSNSFTYTDYKFIIEPTTLSIKENFPSNVIGDDPDITGERYDNIKVDMIGKAPYKTFGEHSFAALQNISSKQETFKMASGTTDVIGTSANTAQTAIFCALSFTQSSIFIPKKNVVSPNIIYSLTADEETLLSTNHSVKIIDDDIPSTSNIGVVRKISSVDATSNVNWIVLTLAEEFPTSPVFFAGSPPNTNNRQYILIVGATYKFQIDELPSGGFGSYDNNGDIIDTKIVYAIDKGNNRDLVPIPSSDFSENVDGNILAISVETATDKTSVETYTTTETLVPLIISKKFQGVSDVTLGKASMSATLQITPDLLYDFRSFTLGASSVGSLFDRYTFISVAPIITINKLYNPTYANFTTTRKKTSFYSSYIFLNSTVTSIVNKSICNVFSFPINHTNDDAFIDNTNLRLSMAFNVKNFGRTLSFYKTYHTPIAFEIFIRFKTVTGTYIDNTYWKQYIPITYTGLTSFDIPSQSNNNQWTFKVNNTPNGTTGGFDINPTPLIEEWTNNTTSIAYVVQALNFTTITLPIPIGYGQEGLRAWLETTPSSALNGLYESVYTGVDGVIGSINVMLFSWVRCTSQPAVGEKILHTDTLNSGVVYVNDIYTIIDVGGFLEADFFDTNTGIQTLKGRDLWKLDESTFGGTGRPLWDTVTSLELIIAFTDFDTNPTYVAQLHNEIEMIKAPAIFSYKEMELIEVPLFSEVQGEGSYTYGNQIVPVILEQSELAGKYDTTSLLNVFAYDAIRTNLLFRRQFTSAINVETMLMEMLKNLWLVAIINEEDKYEFKKLEGTTGSPIFGFDETNIINDSISEITFRKMTEIYQKFRFNSDYYIPSEFSKAIDKWIDTSFVDKANGNFELTFLIKKWSQIYNMQNEMVYDMIYHYDGTGIPQEFINWIVNFFVGNSWRFSIRTSITNIYRGTGVKLMDVVSVDTYFHTANQVVNGFVVGIRPDLYSGQVELDIYVVDPPGKYGVICNPFNDALDVGTRDISGWTELNGRQNDAGDVSTDRSAYGEKDAGNVATRTLQC